MNPMADELTPEMIESWKALDVQIHIVGPSADFWLVHEYTELASSGPKRRLELTPEDFLKQKMVLDEFPDSKIKAFRLPGQTSKKPAAKQKATPRKKTEHPF